MAELSLEDIRDKNDKQRFDAVFMHWPAFIAYLKGPEHIYALANPFYTKLVGNRDLIGKSVKEALPELADQDFCKLLDQVYTTGEPYVGNEALIKLDRSGTGVLEELYVNFVYQPIRNEESAVEGILVHAIDVTEQVRTRQKIEESERRLSQAEEALKHLTLHDSLTGLPNRKGLEERLELVLSIAKRQGQIVAVMFLDLDRFKHINDTLSHHIGDLVLKEISDRLRTVMRQEDTVARVGGDEFIIMLTGVSAVTDVINVAEKILRSLEVPVDIGGSMIHITGSLGISLFPEDGDDPLKLLRNADIAGYRAKEAGRNRYQLFNQTMNAEATERFALGNDLRRAISSNELEIYYQPIVDARANKVAAVEALLRWHHPKLGMVYPQEFIPIAEELGMIFALGKWVLWETCKQHQLWKEAGYPPMRIAVNLSPLQFSEAQLVPVIADILKETNMDPEYLELEITESAAMDNADRTRMKLIQLKKMGISITIDDFGTGYSSLSYLRHFPLDSLKIDKSFVKKGFMNNQDSKIIRTIVAMAHNMNLRVCAEGVETAEQLHYLKSLRCYRMQGFHFSKALPADKFIEWSKEFVRHKRYA